MATITMSTFLHQTMIHIIIHLKTNNRNIIHKLGMTGIAIITLKTLIRHHLLEAVVLINKNSNINNILRKIAIKGIISRGKGLLKVYMNIISCNSKIHLEIISQLKINKLTQALVAVLSNMTLITAI